MKLSADIAGCATVGFQQAVHMRNPWSISKVISLTNF